MNADMNWDRKVVFHEFVRYFPDILDYARIQGIRLRRSDRYGATVAETSDPPDFPTLVATVCPLGL